MNNDPSGKSRIEICRIPPGKTPHLYHLDGAQRESYHAISGAGAVRHKDATPPIETGDALKFKPGESHQISNNGAEDLVIYVVADNLIGKSCYYPDSNKGGVWSRECRLIRSDALDHSDGEE
jgi:uncharacterized cupin superfamily protein